MLYLIIALIATTIALVVVLIFQAIPSRSAAVSRRLAELDTMGTSPFGVSSRRSRQERREQWETLLQTLGDRVGKEDGDTSPARKLLIEAGYRKPEAVSIYRGVRIALPLGLATAALVLLPLAGASLIVVVAAVVWFAITGWIGPAFYVGRRAKLRKKEIQRALPDTLDLLVVCVEAGLGLNQAIVRVAEEIRYVSTITGEEFAMVNLEIRAGTPRAEALRNLGERTGVDDLRSLVAMLIQTDRFGTSVAQALRVHSDTLRIKRRQRAEEAAAKTTIKMLFPLVFFIFPAMFVVILGPAMIQIVEALSAIK